MARISSDSQSKAIKRGKERTLIYKTAIYTGLRRNELKNVKITDIHGDAKPYPYITLRSEITKSGHGEVVPLRMDLAQDISNFVAEFGNKGDMLFSSLPNIKTFKADLKAAGIEYKDSEGRVCDFHALRHNAGNFFMWSC